MSQFPPPQFPGKPHHPQFQGYQLQKAPPPKNAVDPLLARLLIALFASGVIAMMLCSGAIYLVFFRSETKPRMTERERQSLANLPPPDTRDPISKFTARGTQPNGNPILSVSDAVDAKQLQGISLALLNYSSAYARLPAPVAIASDGEKKLSWSASILPFVKAESLVQRIDWSSRWDMSPNLEISQNAPGYFATSPLLAKSPGHTHLYMIVDSEPDMKAFTMFQEGKYRRLADCLDGLSHTAILISVPDRPHNWLEPKNITIADSYAAIQRLGGAIVAMGDGHVAFVQPSVTAEQWKLMTLANDSRAFDSRSVLLPLVSQ